MNVGDLVTSVTLEAVYGGGPYRVEAIYDERRCRCNRVQQTLMPHKCIRLVLPDRSIVVPSTADLRKVS